jgi:hypothetical protein
MKGVIGKAKRLGVVLLLIASSAAAQQAPGNLTGYLPASGEVNGLKLSDAPKTYRGDELFLMINGGADIYHEYGFRQVQSAEYVDASGKSIHLEIYEMESPASAYGIYTFKIGKTGKKLSIGREALLQDYYLNFWKGNLLVTVIGPDAEEEIVQGVVALAKAVDARIADTGERPDLADLLLREPLGFSHPKYIRGSLGVMNSYIFDTENVFRVREGMIGAVADCQAFVFRYAEDGESASAYEHAITKLEVSLKFMDRILQGNLYTMVGREKEFIVVNRFERYITIVIGRNQDQVRSASGQLVEKLKSG